MAWRPPAVPAGSATPRPPTRPATPPDRRGACRHTTPPRRFDSARADRRGRTPHHVPPRGPHRPAAPATPPGRAPARTPSARSRLSGSTFPRKRGSEAINRCTGSRARSTALKSASCPSTALVISSRRSIPRRPSNALTCQPALSARRPSERSSTVFPTRAGRRSPCCAPAARAPAAPAAGRTPRSPHPCRQAPAGRSRHPACTDSNSDQDPRVWQATASVSISQPHTIPYVPASHSHGVRAARLRSAGDVRHANPPVGRRSDPGTNEAERIALALHRRRAQPEGRRPAHRDRRGRAVPARRLGSRRAPASAKRRHHARGPRPPRKPPRGAADVEEFERRFGASLPPDDEG